ncbi:DDB1- and CUL4-associated factor 5 isoform X2 [Pseudomyrmex gracilis]|uniref:DDB1- and CUL4-associated factor 5 isoform X2 n=1 Tax=Pseudomyrmex gracilis TaxID=219809 RepID=UPI0009955A74|nr:DDB1- and CUL4-associated factor 5 isoform X2 [Pseudomyrmex gracilis]
MDRSGDTWKRKDRPSAEGETGIPCRSSDSSSNKRSRRRSLRQLCKGDAVMAHPSVSNALSYVLARQIDDKVDYCRRLISTRFENSENLFKKDLLSHYGCVNAIEFSNQGDLLVSGGDDRRVLLWRVEQAIQGMGKPTVMKAQHNSNIFCLGYDSSKTKIFSAGNDDQVIVHNLRTCNAINLFPHEKPVYGLSIHPHNDDVFASACDDGRVLIYDIRSTSTNETFCLAQYKSAFHSVMFNPMDPRMLATANAKEGVSMWDVRKPLEPVMCYGSPQQSCMNVRFNSVGNRLLALRRRLPPVLYAVDSATYLYEFDHPGYYNSCTMKSCCFAGENDEYVLSGSDDFNLYMWKIPPPGSKPWVENAHMVLRGHRSIVNQVRYNQASCIFASSGVEKIIKIWSPFTLGKGCLGGLRKDSGKREKQRRVFTHDEYIGLVLRSGQFMTHDYSHQSTKEDPRMMAFFDSLVQREIEGWSSEEVHTAPHTPSDSEVNQPTGEPDSPTDVDEDDDASERPLESPNRITRLIANRREKLLRMAAMERSFSESDDDSARAKRRSKSKSKSKDFKRKCSRGCRIRTSTPKKRFTVVTMSKVILTNLTGSDDEGLIDAAQPSTSSGVISRRSSRYVSGAIEKNNKRSRYSSSSSSSEDNDAHRKRKYSETDSDASVKTRRRRHRKYKDNSRHENKNRSKRQKLDDDSDAERTASTRNSPNNRKIRSSTPNNKSLQVPCTPDSGIKSGVSSTEGRTSERNGRNDGNTDDCSDREQKQNSLHCFRLKVEELAKRSYRHRTMPPRNHLISTSSDTSD